MATVRATPATPGATATPGRLNVLAVSVSGITRSSATVTWLSDQPATSLVEFGTTSVDANHSVQDNILVTNHRLVLTGLQSGLTYRFRVRSTIPNGAIGVSGESTFQTSPADSGPEIGSVEANQVTSTTATISWLTGTGNTGQVEYGATMNYSSSTLLQFFTHPEQSITLTGLLPRTTYHFRVRAWDGLGALGASNDFSFSTAAPGPTTLFGEPIIYPQAFGVPGGQAAAYRYVAKESGQANVLRIYLDGGGASVVRVGLYSDDEGSPGEILTQGSTPGLTTGWANVAIPPVSLVRDRAYWVVVLSPLGTANVRELRIGGASMASQQSALAALPANWLASSVSARGPMAVTVLQQPPSVTLLGPTDGAVVGGKTTLSAVVDDDQPVARVQFLVDGVPIGAPVTTAPYSVEWDTSRSNPLQPHVITVTANDMLGRSGTSAGVTVQVDNGPVVRNVVVARGLTASSMRVTWQTDVPSDSQVEFGPSASYGQVSPLNSRADTNHDVVLTGLQPGQVYHFRVRSRDDNGIAGVSVDDLFITPDSSAN